MHSHMDPIINNMHHPLHAVIERHRAVSGRVRSVSSRTDHRRSSFITSVPPGNIYELLLSLRRSKEAGLHSISSTSLSHSLCSGSGSEVALRRSCRPIIRAHIDTVLKDIFHFLLALNLLKFFMLIEDRFLLVACLRVSG